jgi:hypothetical protein
MTLATQILVVEPTPFRPIFDEARRLIGAENGVYEEGPTGIENRWGQGFPSYVGVRFGMDAPLTPDNDEDDYPVDQWSIEVNFDTTYGYQADNGAGCSDLHAYLVQQLGRWLTERGLTWYWLHEYSGEWHPSSDPITILGDPERGRLPDIAVPDLTDVHISTVRRAYRRPGVTGD